MVHKYKIVKLSEVKAMSGAELKDWQLIDWKYVNNAVQNLRQQVFVASRDNDLKKLGSLQKLALWDFAG